MKNVVMVGMPGSGKSTIGVILAKSLGFDFVDTDLVICKREGKKLQEIIDTEGLEKFLEIEQQVGEEISPVNSVVATGGSMILSDEAMKNLKKDGIVVYVEVPLKILKKRITNMKTRGIAFKKGETLEDIFRVRTPLYEKYADITITADENTVPEDCVNQIVEHIEKM
ncbi:MAG TPA: shikimate kinase [Candidatus Limousia pullorum]|uniref:Shikimate kinase n=1 Tax=Candidatus Limousia pullorum TaxID=2840860 RepID=A0A9D1LZ62_9FIRM|nr:shikimate kinase [Anaeromassilibacillus sp. An172]MEE0763025.1 shikimate kinase [Acutalibacteraceae bacterium]OUP76711.1 shikimate kinase [Anaeromassilibacillus sp. An172]HIU50701.1 shikimate kinase [Candidatus Limousia pullorum]